MRITLTLLFAAFVLPAFAREVPDALQVREGPVNVVLVEVDGKRLAINHGGAKPFDTLLITHARRDIVRAARRSEGGRVFASKKSRAILSEADAFWHEWWDDRFDYYEQQVTQRPVENWPKVETLPDRSFAWNGLDIRILETPGYTRDAVSYLLELEGVKIAFVGDLLLAEGKVKDLYSFQNEIREAKVGGYHGHLGRLHLWLESLEALRAENPDVLVPSRGPISRSPSDDIERATALAREIYRNYLSTNALHWYFGEERMNACAEMVLGEKHGVRGMPLAEHVGLPSWCHHIGTTKLLVSDSGRGFALDVGGKNSLATLQQIAEDGLISELGGIFAT
ncbi:MAG: MBL fold metallo-hydrolase, partial [Verrucomicrobiota bacterium]